MRSKRSPVNSPKMSQEQRYQASYNSVLEQINEVFGKKFYFEYESTLHFHDGQRRVDFVLVTTRTKTDTELKQLAAFFTNLAICGVEYEFENGVSIPEFVFVKLHGPDTMLKKIASIHDLVLMMDTNRFSHSKRVNKCLATFIHRPNPNSDIFRRAEHLLTYRQPTEMIGAERILSITLLLNEIENNDGKKGLDSLYAVGLFKTGYVLHDGPIEMTTTGPLSERQLLMQYWASAAMFYKRQPLYAVRRYFGPEVAFYFAFIGLYNNMLFFGTLGGLATLIYSLIHTSLIDEERVEEICNSKIFLCPPCKSGRTCSFVPLSGSCSMAQLSTVMDNNVMVLYSIIMSLWATLFTEMWRRRENQLMFKWNILNANQSTEIREAYRARTPYRRISEATGDWEPYTPLYLAIGRYTVSMLVITVMVLTVSTAVLGTVFYRMAVVQAMKASSSSFFQKNANWITMTSGAAINVSFVKLFSMFYRKISVALTELENPRTREQYHNSCIFKAYVLAFVNNYFPFFYTAFVQSKFYTYPGDQSVYRSRYSLKADFCHPSGCVMGLAIQITFLMFFRNYMKRIFMYIIPIFKVAFRWMLRSKKIPKPTYELPRWEQDYNLGALRPLFLVPDYCDAVIQFGMVTFFIASNPLVPLLALINNTLEIRVKAMRLITSYRRPMPRRLPGIGTWNNLLKVTAHLGTITSAFLIAFTSDFIPRSYHFYTTGTLDGHVMSSMSKFRVADIPEWTTINKEKLEYCYYRGDRFPPGHPKEYQLNADFWYKLTLKLLFIVAYEHIVWLLNAVFRYLIPTMPESVESQLQYESEQKRKQQFGEASNTVDTTRKNTKQSISYI